MGFMQVLSRGLTLFGYQRLFIRWFTIQVPAGELLQQCRLGFFSLKFVRWRISIFSGRMDGIVHEASVRTVFALRIEDCAFTHGVACEIAHVGAILGAFDRVGSCEPFWHPPIVSSFFVAHPSNSRIHEPRDTQKRK